MFTDLPRSTGKIGQKAKTAPMGPHAILAGPVRFELTMDFSTPVFKTGAFNRSATDPMGAHNITNTFGAIVPHCARIIETSFPVR